MELQQIKDLRLNFILTTARTGSTLLSSMLNMHPNVISTLEEPFAYSSYSGYKNVKKWTSETIQQYCYDFYLFSEGKFEVQFSSKKELESVLEMHKENLTIDLAIKLTYLCFFPNKDKSNITTVVDKQLLFHSCLEDVASFYPQSKFIILHRDPRDNAFTKWRMYQNKKQFKHQNYYLIASLWQYTYGRILRLKNKIGSERFLDVKYEDLVTNPESELKKISSFLGIEYTGRMLEYDERIKSEIDLLKEKQNKNSIKYFMPFQDGIIQKPKTNKIGYWKQELTADEANLVWTICGDLAEKIGYKKDAQFIAQPITLKDRWVHIKMIINRVKTKIYYSSPFFIKRLLKKLKYGKGFKTYKWESHEFYRKSFYGN